MSRVRLYKLAAIFQQILPGMYQESGVQNMMVPRLQDREGNLFWSCFHCSNPIRGENGLYVADEDDLENFERYTQYEETLSDEDVLSTERLVDARMANDKFYADVKNIVADLMREINDLSDEELMAVYRSYDGELQKRFKDINTAFKEMLGKVEFLFSKHYYYNIPAAFHQISEMQLGYSYWPQFDHYWYGGEIRAKAHKRFTTVLTEAWEKYKLINKVVAIASQAAGTKKHLIQRHIMNHPVCDRCFKNVGAECYVPDCNFTSPDIEDDFHEIEIEVFDENTNKTYKDDKLFCEEHGFECYSCGKDFISNPYELFGTHDDTYGYGKREFDNDSYCDDCFNESFGNCEECNRTLHIEDLVYDEKTESQVCNNCATGAGDRESGVEEQLSSKEVAVAQDFASDPFGINVLGKGKIGFYPIDPKAINTQILPALKKIRNKQFHTFDQWKSWLMKRVQSKDAKAAVLAEFRGFFKNPDDLTDEVFKEHQQQYADQLTVSFTQQLHQSSFMAENYPGLRGYKPLAVDVTVERTPGHKGHSFVIRPQKKLIDYADMVMPGAKEAYEKYLSHRGHHSGALAYARFTKSDGKIVIDNLQTDLDSQAFSYELRKRIAKPLQWWLTAAKKFWAPFMLNLLRHYGEKTDQEVYLTSYKMQKSKWRTIPERSKDLYDRMPEMMGFPRKKVKVKPEDLSRKEYGMRRIAEFVDMFCKLANRRLINLKRLSGRMVEIDSSLTSESANWNHNLAHAFRILARVAGKPSKLERILDKFDPEDWLQRGPEALKEIGEKDERLAKDIKETLYLMLLEPDLIREELSSPIPQQPCKQCDVETSGDAYVRYSSEGDVISPLCLSCAMKHDNKHESTADFMDRWVNDPGCSVCGDTRESEGWECPGCGTV